MIDWKHELLLDRIRGLNDAKMLAFTDAKGMFHGAPRHVGELIDNAIQLHEMKEFDKCERACVEAEQVIIDARISDHDIRKPFTYADALSCRLRRVRQRVVNA
jgi:hypothetical protein